MFVRCFKCSQSSYYKVLECFESVLSVCKAKQSKTYGVLGVFLLVKEFTINKYLCFKDLILLIVRMMDLG